MFFHGLNGPTEPPQLLEHAKSIQARPGVDGVSVRKDGAKGRPFPMMSFKDEQTLQGALDEFDRYKQETENGGPSAIKWENGDWSSLYATDYVAHSVRLVSVRKVSPITATAVKTTTSPAWVLQCLWVLIPVAREQV